ncbi:2'-5' RNA ligase family protein [Pseudooceanicola sp. CBS1P-1]|uniref:2'-5' RNA ligase family protein n=1 Tax=Pseudooceanicola albus TaxID=2692189 RepID=A0A6L7G9Y3_9RHOB|nr:MULTISPECIES: 2'-5' RNA ligase family protein [Pseudooceanicola]MBT9386289.1 2'-5' RNA ligase family protein [Pseudooceanicola endophyticus]MXN20338.1 hypothetical protein [Pseudooceanicola albus]
MNTTSLVSVWLAPADPEATALQAEIDRIAGITGTEAFRPHVTLLGDIAVPRARLSQVLRDLARLPAPGPLVRDLAGEATRFRALYLDLAPCAGLAALRQRLEAALPEVALSDAFRPHLSLGYGNKAHARLGTERENLKGWTGKALRLGAVQLVRSAQDVPVADWQVLESHPLG